MRGGLLPSFRLMSPDAGRNHSAGSSVASAAAPAMDFSRSTASRRSALLPGSTSAMWKPEFGFAASSSRTELTSSVSFSSPAVGAGCATSSL